MSITIIRSRGWEASFVKGSHERKLFHTGDTGHVKPAALSTFQVVSIVFDSTETGTTESCKFDDDRLSAINTLSIFIDFIPGLADVDIRFFTDTDLGQNPSYVASFHENLDGQIIVTLVCQRIPTVILSCVEDQLML